MPATTPSLGAQSRLWFNTALPFSSGSVAIEFESNSIAKKGNIIATDGIRGTRQQGYERTRVGNYSVGGALTMPASPLMLDCFLPGILGGAVTATVCKLAETLPFYYLMEDKQATVFTWSACKTNKATFRASMGKTLMLTLDVEAQTEATAGTAPSVTMPLDAPYVLTDAVLTINSISRPVAEIELTIDNRLITDRFENTLTRIDFPSQGVDVRLNTNNPFSPSEMADLYGVGLNGFSGATLIFTNSDVGTSILTINIGQLQIPDNTPQTSGRGEIRLPLQMEARRIGTTLGTTDAIKFTNAHA